MSQKIAVRITNFRTPPAGGFADGFFTTELGFEHEDGSFEAFQEIRDCELRTSRAQEKYVAWPKKPRIKKIDDKTAAYQFDGAGKVIYDPVVSDAREKKGDEFYQTRASKTFKNMVLSKVLEIHSGQRAETNGRGSGRATPRPADVQVADNVGTGERNSPLISDDDELPFG